MSTTYPPWPLYLSGWTTDKNGGHIFTNQVDFQTAVSKAIAKRIIEEKEKYIEDPYTIDSYHCRASFLPQPLESGECPSATLPFKDEFYKSWDKIQSFITSVQDWPYIEVVANISRNQHDAYSKTGRSFPVHIFYRRLKPS